jgi:hypothetical protein
MTHSQILNVTTYFRITNFSLTSSLQSLLKCPKFKLDIDILGDSERNATGIVGRNEGIFLVMGLSGEVIEFLLRTCGDAVRFY